MTCTAHTANTKLLRTHSVQCTKRRGFNFNIKYGRLEPIAWLYYWDELGNAAADKGTPHLSEKPSDAAISAFVAANPSFMTDHGLDQFGYAT